MSADRKTLSFRAGTPARAVFTHTGQVAALIAGAALACALAAGQAKAQPAAPGAVATAPPAGASTAAVAIPAHPAFAAAQPVGLDAGEGLSIGKLSAAQARAIEQEALAKLRETSGAPAAAATPAATAQPVVAPVAPRVTSRPTQASRVLGVYGRPGDMQAEIMLGDGSVKVVTTGFMLSGWKVTGLGASGVTFSKGAAQKTVAAGEAITLSAKK